MEFYVLVSKIAPTNFLKGYSYMRNNSSKRDNKFHCQDKTTICAVRPRYYTYNGIPFCSLEKNHDSWGASVEKNKNVNFKLFTFPDVDEVSVEIKSPYKAALLFPLKNQGGGVFENVATADIVKQGDRYRFVINRNGKKIIVRDPYAMHRENIDNWSIIYDHNSFKWSDSAWRKGHVPEKVSRKANEYNGLAPVSALRIYEAHIGTLSDEGTFKAAKKMFKKIAEDKKFNAVEIMPVENTYGYNWGYDGVDKFAPRTCLGKPDELKELIDYAHSLKLNVIMDIVPNHLGPDMADLQNAGPYLKGNGPFGGNFNLESCESQYVREYIVNTALNWLKNYHCDGLRVDMTKLLDSDSTLKQMAAEVHYHVPDAFLIAEDARGNDPRVTRQFPGRERSANEQEHCNYINKILSGKVSLDSIGFDSEWDFPFHKEIAASILGEWDYHHKNMDNLDRAVIGSGTRVKYPMSHDEIGNIDGTRLIDKVIVKDLSLYDSTVGKTVTERAQRSTHAAHSMSQALVSGRLDKMSEPELSEFLQENHLNKIYSIVEIRNSFIRAIKQHRLAVGKTYSVPGPKMIFQGDEEGNLSYFKFFRKFSTGYEKGLENKGYRPGDTALNDSKLSSIPYTGSYKRIKDETALYVRDLNVMMDENPALQSGIVAGTVSHPISNVHAVHAKKGNNEIFSVSNFTDEKYQGSYYINFPKGKWVEISNTDMEKYGGSGEYLNPTIYAEQGQQIPISLPDFGMIFFKKV